MNQAPDPPVNATPHQWAEFGRWVARLHQIKRMGPVELDECTCGSYAVTCPYIRAQRDILGLPVPWDRPPGRRDGTRPSPHRRPG